MTYKAGLEGAEARISVVVADSDPLAARVVRDALQGRPGFAVAGVAADAREALELVRHYRPDVAVVDTAMPGDDGIEMVRRIAEGADGIAIVVFSRSGDERDQLEAIEAGAIGFLPKSMGTDRLPEVVRAVARGEAAISREVTTRLIENFRNAPRDGIGMRPVWSELTTREWQVLDLLTQGLSTRSMAAELNLSEDTVYGHVKGVLRKLNVSSRAEAAEVAGRIREPMLAR